MVHEEPDPACTVTLKLTPDPLPPPEAVTSHGLCAVSLLVSRNTCASPPALVWTSVLRPPALQYGAPVTLPAAGGSVNVMLSLAIGAPVSRSSSRTLRATLLLAPISVVPLEPSAETWVVGVPMIWSNVRMGMTLKLKATGSGP